MESGIIVGILAGLVAGFAVLIVAMLPPPVACSNCGARLPRFDGWLPGTQPAQRGKVCQNCGSMIDAHGNKVEPAEMAQPAAASTTPVPSSARRNAGCAVTVLGVLFLLLGIVALLILGAFGFSDTAAQAIAQGDTDQIVVPLLTCPLPLLIVGGAVFYLGRRLARQSR